VRHIRAVQHRLGRDAAPVRADATEFRPLDDGDPQAVLGRPDRGHLTAGTRADHDQVERVRLSLPG
jgi:hypothetical protein